MPGEILDTFSDFLKVDYIPGIRSILNKSSYFYMTMQKNSGSIVGKQATVPLQRGLLPVSARGERGTIGPASNVPKETAQIPLRYFYVLIEFSGIVDEASKSDIGAFISVMTSQTVAAQNSLKREQNMECILTNEGELTQMAEVVATGAKTALSIEVDSTQYCYPGQRLGIRDKNDLTSEKCTDGLMVDTIVDSTHIKVTGTVVTQLEADDGVYGFGNRGYQMGGLGDIFQTDNTYLAVNRANVAEWVPNINNNSSAMTDLDLNMMQKAIDDSEANAEGNISLITAREAMRRSYVDLLTADKRYVPPRLLDLDGGFQGLEYSGGSKPVHFVAERDMTPNTIYFLDQSTFTMYRMGGGAKWKEDRGRVIIPLFGADSPIDAVRSLLYVYQNLACTNPRKNSMISYLNES